MRACSSSMAAGAHRAPPRSALADLLVAGDLVVANDAATLPASLAGTHRASGAAIEVRLAGRRSLAADDVARFVAVVFGAGDWRTRTEDRPLPPPLAAGDALALGPLRGDVVRVARPSAPGRAALRRRRRRDLGRHRPARPAGPVRPPRRAAGALGRVDARSPALPVAFEAPSAGFVLDWRLLDALRGARRRLRDADPRRRPVVDRRRRARRAAAVRRAVSPAGGDGRRRRRRTRRAAAASSRSARRSRARSSTPPRSAGGLRAGAGVATQPARPQRRRCASSTRSSAARTSRARATTSCCARSSPTRRSARDRRRARAARLPHPRVRRLGAGRARARAQRRART